MRNVILLVAVAGLLGGCAGTQWCHNSKGAREFETDKRRCMHQASQYAASWGSAGNPFMIADDARQCLQLEFGWYQCPAGN